MSFRVIQGQYRITNSQPDGDSIRFVPDNKQSVYRIRNGRNAGFKSGGAVQLRLEAIDTLETHFAGLHQPRAHADAATDFLLASLGFQNVVWSEKRTVISADDGVRGFILAREVEKNARVVAFAFAGEPPAADGETFFLDALMIKNSSNYKLVEAGLAYPTYYTGLYRDLREAFTAATLAARSAGVGLWPDDRSTQGFRVQGMDTLTAEVVVLPKLFRRLADYLGSEQSVVGFDEFLDQQQEKVQILSENRFTDLGEVVEEKGGQVRMLFPPEDLVFLPF